MVGSSSLLAVVHRPVPREGHHQGCTLPSASPGLAPCRCGHMAAHHRHSRPSPPFHNMAARLAVFPADTAPLRHRRTSTGEQRPRYRRSREPGAPNALSSACASDLEPHLWWCMEPGLVGAVLQHDVAHPATIFRMVCPLGRWLSHDCGCWYTPLFHPLPHLHLHLSLLGMVHSFLSLPLDHTVSLSHMVILFLMMF